VVAETTPVAYRIVAELPGATVLVGRVSALRVVIAVPKKDAAATLPTLNEFLGDAKGDDFLAEAIKKANLRGVCSPR